VVRSLDKSEPSSDNKSSACTSMEAWLEAIEACTSRSATLLAPFSQSSPLLAAVHHSLLFSHGLQQQSELLVAGPLRLSLFAPEMMALWRLLNLMSRRAS
jgi:hypothetical protein